jgi:hypothetical protein
MVIGATLKAGVAVLTLYLEQLLNRNDRLTFGVQQSSTVRQPHQDQAAGGGAALTSQQRRQ